jgi:phosphoglycerate dehydrogenase-like enzyme
LVGVLPEIDYLVLAAPLTEETRGMVDATALAAMKPTARLVNVGRGPLVVQDDLVAALRAEALAGAALDVFVDEPLPADSPLWAMPNVIVSPHMSGDVVGWRSELVALFSDNLARYLAGQPLRNVVDKTRGYVRGTG